MNDSTASLEKIQSALSFVSPQDRDVWVKMAMAVKSELGEDGFWVWDDWSQGADNYNASAAKSVWKGIKAGGKVNVGSLFYEAKQTGWAWNKPERRLSAAEVTAMREASRLKAEAAAAEKAAQQAKTAELAAAIWSSAEPAAAHPYLSRKRVNAHGLRIGKWEIVDSETGEVRLITPLALLVPIKDRTGKLWSLQAIFPRKMMGGRDKDYLAGGAKAGHFHAIGKPKEHDGRKVFVIAEGYATGASIHETTGHCVLVTFDTGNLLPVASAIRERQPDAIILFAADNDQFNRRKDDTPYNPGVEAARKAAAEVAGLVAIPQFESLEGNPTDFNDLHVREGSGAVLAQITAALAGQVAEDPVAEAEEAPPAAEQPPAPTFEQLAQDLAQQPAAEDPELDEQNHLAKNKYFTILGYDHEDYFFFVHAKQQVFRKTSAGFNEVGLIQLANDINWWEMNFPAGKGGGINTKAAFQWIDAVANSRGVYDPSRVRGRGAWIDSGRMVFHHGSYLTVDGEKVGIADIDSAYVYPKGKSFVEPASTVMTAEEGKWLLSVAEMVRWRSAGSAAMMAGWTMLAPICGALKWRPHIWITGAAGSGKSTIQRDFCVALLNGVGAYFLGDSSEPGIRQDLKSDALPVLIDEIESNNESDRRRVEGIIGMVRKSSSETQARTAKGTTTGDGMSFMVRSMFCLSSINVNLPGKADIDRLTKLVIRPPAIDGEVHWAKLADELYKITSDQSISRRLLARALAMMPTIHSSIAVFSKAAAAKFGTQRHGDQYGTLLAGCWCLTNDSVPNQADAEAMLNRYDWNEHTEDHGEDDAIDALKSIMNAKIRMPGSIGDLTVFELAQEASFRYRTGRVEQGDADAALRRHGIRLEEATGYLLFGTSVTNLKTLLRDSSCSTDIRGQLLRLKDATRWNDKTVKFNGIASKCVAVPMGLIFEEDAPSAPPPPAGVPAKVPDDYPI